MLCKRYERLMVDYLAGELTQAEKEMVMEHLKGCHKCAELFEEYREVIEKSRSIEIPVPEGYVWEKKLAEIRAGQPLRHVHILKPIGVFAALLLIISLFFAKVPNNGKGNVVVRNTNKNGYGIVLPKLPCSEGTLLKRIDYIDEESASEIMDIVLNTPVFPLYEY